MVEVVEGDSVDKEVRYPRVLQVAINALRISCLSFLFS